MNELQRAIKKTRTAQVKQIGNKLDLPEEYQFIVNDLLELHHEMNQHQNQKDQITKLVQYINDLRDTDIII